MLTWQLIDQASIFKWIFRENLAREREVLLERTEF